MERTKLEGTSVAFPLARADADAVTDEPRAAGASAVSEARALRPGPAWWVRHALAGGLLLGFAAVLLGIAFHRAVDGDEPFYAAAIDSVAEGRRLYADFFHPQGPIQPLLYSLFHRVGPLDVRGLRCISVACCVLSGVVWWRWLTALMPRFVVAPLCLLAVTLADGAFFTWGASLKTYCLTTLLTACGGYAWWEGFRRSESRKGVVWFALSGLSFTLAAGARVSFAAPAALLSLVLLARAAWSSFRRQRWLVRDLAGWGGGAAAGSAVTAYQWLRAPEAFWFDTVTAQRLREAAPKGAARVEYLFYVVHDSVIAYPWLSFVVASGTAPALALAFGAGESGARRHSDASLVALPAAGVAYVVAMLQVYPQYGQYYEASLGAFFLPCVLVYAARHAHAVPASAFVLFPGLLLSNSAFTTRVRSRSGCGTTSSQSYDRASVRT